MLSRAIIDLSVIIAQHALDLFANLLVCVGRQNAVRCDLQSQLEVLVVQQPSDGPHQFLLGESVRVQAHAKSGFVDTLCVVILVPEHRHHYHGLSCTTIPLIA